MTRIQRDTVLHIFIALGSAALLLWVIPAYTPPYPGYGASPALVPNVAVGIMLVMAILRLVRNAIAYWLGTTHSPEEAEYPDEMESSGFSQVGRAKLLHLTGIIVPCVLLIPAINWVGYIPAAVGFMLLIQYIIGRREHVRAVVLAVIVVAVVYVSMRYGFRVPIPGA